MDWNKALVAGAVGGLTGAALAYANAVPQVTRDEVFVISAAVLTGFTTGLATYYTRNGEAKDKSVEDGKVSDLTTHTSQTVGLAKPVSEDVPVRYQRGRATGIRPPDMPTPAPPAQRPRKLPPKPPPKV